MQYNYLSKIESPDGVKALSADECNALCDEIRHCLIDTVSKNGGHLSSNLGTVELTVALHRSFDSPRDSILFDVGHQSYTHKLLTGRFKNFSTLRKKGGLCPFMNPLESEYDPFITGHSSNAVSASYGIFKAKRLSGDNSFCVTVVGDGALTGGLTYEALNNAGASKNGFIVVLNDNKMSISRNIGALARHLTKIRINPKYHKFKLGIERILNKIPFFGKHLVAFIFKIKSLFKNAIYHSNVFECLGFSYIGPVDGHNISQMEDAFSIAKMQKRPAFVHVVTTKGKGFAPAEKKPDIYHGVSSFDIDTGTKSSGENFSTVAGNTLCNLAKQNSKICAITAAMPENTGLSNFSKEYKDRFFDVGIAEEHAVTFAAGLSTKGYIPIFAVFSSFLQRAFDQIIHDVSLTNQNVTFLVDRAGIVGEDGATHQGLYDVSYLSCVAGMQIFAPSNYDELVFYITKAAQINGPVAVRYPRGKENEILKGYKHNNEDYRLFKGDGKTLIITYGRIFANAFSAKNQCEDISVLKLNKIFPINDEIINIIKNYSDVHFFEESVQNGSVAEKLGALIAQNNIDVKYTVHAIKDARIKSCTVDQALEVNRLDTVSMLNTVMENSK